MWRNRWMYLFVLPGLVYFLVFAYLPLAGNVVAFQNFSPFLGIKNSPWVGFQNFTAIFGDPEFVTAMKNTLVVSFLQIIFAFPAPILLALLLNSLLSDRTKRFVQSIVYLPHFFGWVIVISMWAAVFGGIGPFSDLMRVFGSANYNLMADANAFKELVTAQVIWKEIGWGTIIFFAAISAIPSERYEAAALDGANGLRRTWHVTLPGIASVTVLLLILRLGSVLTVGFEQMLLQQHAVGADASEVLDTYAYFRGVVGGEWGVAAAAGLFKGVIGIILIIGANKVAKRMGHGGLF
jgi:putative aldouronate transport system permease protein